DQSALAAGVVYEHLRDGSLTARNQVGIWRDLLEKVTLARPARTKLDEIVVPLDKGDHTKKHDALRPLGEGRCFETDRAHQEIDPFGSAEFLAGLGEGLQDVSFRHLDRSQALYLERAPTFFLGDYAIVCESDLGVETIGQHSFVFTHMLIVDADVPEI